jgi:serine/threonine protein kinase
LDALEHAHGQDILHRDIKPDNILLQDKGTIKITDFGIARALGSARLTRDARLVGTLEYLAPERVKGLEGDYRCDLYSTGAVLYELLTGHLPFERDTDFELMRAQLEEMPPPLRQWTSDVPEQLESFMCRALAKAPEDRFGGAAEMRTALLKIDWAVPSPAEVPVAKATRFAEPLPAIRETKVVDSADVVIPSPVVRPGLPFFRRPIAWIGLACLAVVALVVLFSIRLSHNPPDPASSGSRVAEVPANQATQHAATPASSQPPPVAESAPASPVIPAAGPVVPAAQEQVPASREEAREAQTRAENAKRRAAALKALDQ